VTEAGERAVQLRALVSAPDAGSVWDLRCVVRERLLGFIQREYPEYLPRVRADNRLEPSPGDGGGDGGDTGPGRGSEARLAAGMPPNGPPPRAGH
jgi:hypothetical protein